MFRAEHSALGREHTRCERFGFGVLAQEPENIGQVPRGPQGLGVIRPETLLAQPKAALPMLPSRGELAKRPVGRCERVANIGLD